MFRDTVGPSANKIPLDTSRKWLDFVMDSERERPGKADVGIWIGAWGELDLV
jgi:hypothetical protein